MCATFTHCVQLVVCVLLVQAASCAAADPDDDVSWLSHGVSAIASLPNMRARHFQQTSGDLLNEAQSLEQVALGLESAPRKKWFQDMPTAAGNTDHFDAHNHVGGELGWRGIIIAYLWASRKPEWVALEEHLAPECHLQPAQFKRKPGTYESNRQDCPFDDFSCTGIGVKDLCFYHWLRTVYLRKGPSDSYPPQHNAALALITKTAADFIHHWDGVQVLGGSTNGRTFYGSHTLAPLYKCIKNEVQPSSCLSYDDACIQLERLIDSTVTASPQIDFDSSYVSKDALDLKSAQRSFEEDMNTECVKWEDFIKGTYPSPDEDEDKGWCTNEMKDKLEKMKNDEDTDRFFGASGNCAVGRHSAAMRLMEVVELTECTQTSSIQWSNTDGAIPMPFGRCMDIHGESGCTWQASKAQEYNIWFGEHAIPAARKIHMRVEVLYLSKIFGATGKECNPTLSQLEYEVQSGKGSSARYDCMPPIFKGRKPYDDHIFEGLSKFLEYDHINGVDFASPEFTLYKLVKEDSPGTHKYTVGGKLLKKVLDKMLEKAKHKSKTHYVHIHCGEGFPIFDYKEISGTSDADDMNQHACHYRPKHWEPAFQSACPESNLEQSTECARVECKWSRNADIANDASHMDMTGPKFDMLCNEAKKPWGEQTALKKVMDGDKPKQYAAATSNMQAVLDFLEVYRADKDCEDFDKHVVIVLGHALGATESVAQQMARLHVWGDINLSSNLATGAIVPRTSTAPIEISKLLRDNNYDPSKFMWLESLAEQLKKPTDRGDSPSAQDTQHAAAVVQDIYRDHGLYELYKAGACITLGTDGAGAEHSHFQQEFALAELAFYGKEGVDVQEVMNKLAHNENQMAQFMSTPPDAPLSCAVSKHKVAKKGL